MSIRVVEGCSSNDVRRRILLKDLAFTEIETLGIAQEGVDQQIEDIVAPLPQEKIFRIGQQKRIQGKPISLSSRTTDRTCFNCGRTGHYAVSAACPARGKQCRNCKSYGHFEKLCRKAKRLMEKDSGKQVRTVDEMPQAEVPTLIEKHNDETKVYYAFYSGNESNVIKCILGGVHIEMFVDSGADANLISGKMWSKLKDDKTEASVACLVTKQQNNGVLKVGLNISTVEANPFSIIKGVKAHIRIDPTAVPLFQPMRRVPIPLEEAVGRKLDDMLRGDIIELARQTECLDLRRVNEAVLREHHPMPFIDDYLAKIGRGCVWSKLDIKEAFLQVELDEASRDATTFITSRGLYRFKRLSFGLVTAPELFQKSMDEILVGCEGTFWYIDDVIVEGKTLEEHDKRLDKVL
ncbi:uncharacterized protein K02A2.6-like [Topomyia yanbarensis]|uniref:uncharacterized protein K02A2.6-like n=1 Tax=Topomyia yanbarensis TaxID=2498891 RepID=UPI00273C5DD1|nr:uncharacterized protein K02A2.6-like [Topomyia yanbarensis]